MSQSSYAVKVKKSSPRQRVGVSFVAEDDIVRVSKIEPGLAASTTDLREGDKILSINGKEISGLSAKETATILRQSSGDIEILASNDEEDVESFNKAVEEAETETEAEYPNVASTMSPMLGLVILIIQILTAGFIFTHFDYGSDSDFNKKEYIVFRDIMVMLLLGFGYCKFSVRKCLLFCDDTIPLLLSFECFIFSDDVLGEVWIECRRTNNALDCPEYGMQSRDRKFSDKLLRDIHDFHH